ncbi:MAG: prepilin-type N-terminal cleavage/methylation domain-containing protein [Myxococcota bacterium]|nr:prepilin-type N-terminal cleavage/methylation domain-containing protein [Myxococcota bacterium]
MTPKLPYGPMIPSAKRGFTLIELVITLAIGLMVIGLVTMGINNIRRADLKAGSGMMAGAMRYLYNLAVINNTPYRLVIDMDEGAFWGEEMRTDDPCARYLPEAGDDDLKRDKEDRGLEEGEDPTAAQGGYSRTKDNLLSTRKLPLGIQVTGVITSHHRSVQSEGRAAIHFFPGGYAERAMIWLGEREGPDQEAEPEVTLALDGLMGRVRRHSEALDESTFVRESE